MTWNFRSAGNWSSIDPKKREGGQWVSLGSSSGGGGGGGDGSYPARFYTSGPPDRSGTTYNYDGTNYSSLQALHDNDLSPGDTIYIDPSNSPYVERLQVTTNNITIESDGTAWIENPDTNDDHTILFGEHQGGGHGFHPEDTELDGSHDGKQVTDQVNVVDSSPFSVGDDIFIEEDRRPYGEPESGGASGAETTHEYKVITDIDSSTDTLTVHHPLFLPYPNIEPTAAGVMDWIAEDVVLSGVNLRGHGSDGSRVLQCYGVRDAWIEDVTIEDAGTNSSTAQYSFNLRFDNVNPQNAIENANPVYGLNFARSTTQGLITNVTADNIGHYGVRWGPGGGRAGNSVDGLVDNLTGRNFDHNGPVSNTHWGGIHVEYRNVTGDGIRAWRTRSREVVLDGGEETGASGGSFTTRQRPTDCTARNYTITNKSSGYVFFFNMRDDYNERGDNLTFEDISIDQYDGNSITDIGYFNTGDGGCIIDGLHFKNVTYGDQKLSKSDVQNWHGYSDSATEITNLTVE